MTAKKVTSFFFFLGEREKKERGGGGGEKKKFINIDLTLKDRTTINDTNENLKKCLYHVIFRSAVD